MLTSAHLFRPEVTIFPNRYWVRSIHSLPLVSNVSNMNSLMVGGAISGSDDVSDPHGLFLAVGHLNHDISRGCRWCAKLCTMDIYA